MRITTVFNKLLSLQGAFVQQVEFLVGVILVTVIRRARLHCCPKCKFSTSFINAGWLMVQSLS